jgi:uncharacterized protein YbaP (TraB family)
MKNHIAFVLTSLLLVGCSSIQKPFFWKLEKDNKTSYMLGTIHRGIYIKDLPEYVIDPISKSKTVYTEIPHEDQATNGRYDDKIFWRSNEELPINLAEQLGPELNAQLVNNWNILKIKTKINEITPLGILDLMFARDESCKVWVTKAKVNRMNYKFSLDRNISELARKNGVASLGLDDYDDPDIRSCYWSADLETLKEYLSKGCQAAGKAREVDIFENEYLAGNEKAVSKFNSEITPAHQCILKVRNEKWLPKIEAAHNLYGPAYIAVGVAHFYEDFGLIKMLQDRGYTVTRMTSDK